MKKLTLSLLAGVAISISFNVFTQDIIKLSLEQAQEGNFEQAKEIIEDAAISGNPEAQLWLSRFYRDPNGLNLPEVGEEWLIKAANNGYPRAQYDYAWDLSAGWVKAPIERIIKMIYWFEKAGHNGIVEAYGNLSALYDKEPRDVLTEMEAEANKGNAMAQFNMGWINARGLQSEDGLMQNEDVANEWFKRAAEQGFKDAID
jgi:hypothetical protein